MSYQERRTIVDLISTILISVIYTAIMVQRYPQDSSPYSAEVFRFWGSFFLILVLVSIVAKIIIFIIFAIINAIATRDEEIPITDERDKLFEWQSNLRSGYVFIFGFMLSMGSLVVDMPPAVMFSILFCSGIVSEIISDVSQFYFYRRGI